MRSAIWRSGSARSRTVASSMASGMPSSLRQTVMTSARFSGVTVKPGTAAAARCANSSTASAWPADSSLGSGTGSGNSCRTASPDASSGCLLVARMMTPGAARRTVSASAAHASTRCSQVSRMSSSSRSRMKPSSVSSCDPWSASALDSSASVSPAATVYMSSPGSRTPDSSIRRTPSRKPAAASLATRTASRVLPTPPVPLMVTSRDSRSRSRALASSATRPTNPDVCGGSMPGVR